MDSQQAITLLSQQQLLHIDMLQAFARNQADLLFADECGVLLYHRKGATHMLSVLNHAAADRLIALIPDDAQMVVAHQSECVPQIRQRFGFETSMVCHQVAYLSKTPPEPLQTCEIRTLDARQLDFVAKHYSHISDRGYLLDRLEAGVMHGAYVEGELAGFIGEHAEGSLGILEVLPAYRRRGIARALQAYMTQWTLAQGHIPFAQVEQGNTASLQLQRSLGYECSDGLVYWLY